MLLLLEFVVARFDQTNNPYYTNFGSDSTICPEDGQCLDGTFNFLCADDSMKQSPDCKRFVPIPVSLRTVSRMVNVHNGLRNKMAHGLRLSNMNLVYWNIHLQRMAEAYLYLCRPYKDTCLVIGYSGIAVGQNTIYVPKRKMEVLKEWEGRAVRHWYLELGSSISSPDELMGQKDWAKLENFTQLFWPKLQFIGCGAAIMFDGFFVVCYYYPSAQNESITQAFTYLGPNEICVCPEERVMCSLLFTSLCGIDLEFYNGIGEISMDIHQFTPILFNIYQ
ncbi:venom allergen 5-like [Drosophila busckii]|uniref:venom allergen 5-like n=1 Tax=Drosophila busckii TaxID=30019 RepID=UPI0014333E27|nr:venom allergen 5-like [Drosophila busckii]